MPSPDDLLVQRFVRAVRRTVADAVAGAPDIQGATVTQVSPLMVKLHTASTAAPAYAITSAYPNPKVGDNVLVHIIRKELYVAGTV